MDNQPSAQTSQFEDPTPGRVAGTQDGKETRKGRRLKPSYVIKDNYRTLYKPFKCGVCSYTTAVRSNLKVHMLRHGDKPYKCDQCNYAAIRKKQFLAHMKHHAADSPLKCKQCGFSANQLNVLTKHMVVHTKKGAAKTDNVAASQKEEHNATSPTEGLHLGNELETSKKSGPSTSCQQVITKYMTGRNKKGENVTNATPPADDRDASKQTIVKSEPEKNQEKKCKTRLRTRTKKRVRFTDNMGARTKVNWTGGTDNGEDLLFLDDDVVPRPRKKPKRFKCRECGFSTAYKHTLTKHMLLHGGDRPYKCEQCSYASVRKAHLRVHMKCHPTNSPLKCRQCAFSTRRKIILDRHIAGHTETDAGTSDNVTTQEDGPSTSSAGEQQQLINLCASQINNSKPPARLTSRKTHAGIRKKSSNVKLEASQDSTHKTEDKQSLQDHLSGTLSSKQRKGNKRFKCKECSYSSPHKQTLKRHTLTHSGEKPHKCDQCSYATIRKSNLLIHMKCHTTNSPLTCQQCGFSTKHRNILGRHMAVHRREKADKSAATSAAQEEESNSAVAVEHLFNDLSGPGTDNESPPSKRRKTQTENKVEKPNNVATVKSEANQDDMENAEDRKSPQDRSLGTSNNSKQRSESKPFQCKECGYSTAYKGDLKRHQLRHGGERPYKCDKCPYAAIEKLTLLRHIERHTSDGPLKCVQCGFSAKSRNVLARHTALHKGKKTDKRNNLASSTAQECGPSSPQVVKQQVLIAPSESETDSSPPPATLRKTNAKKKFSNAMTTAKLEASKDGTEDTEGKQSPHVHRGKKTGKRDNLASSTSQEDGNSSPQVVNQQACSGPSEPETDSSPPAKRRKMHARKKFSKAMTTLKLEESQDGTENTENKQSPQDRFLRTLNWKQTSKSKPFACKECSYSTAYKADLKRHQLRHGGERPYKCDQCSYAAIEKLNLRRHMKRHTAKDPLKCVQCGFSTKRKGVLTRHMAVHRAEEAKKSVNVTPSSSTAQEGGHSPPQAEEQLVVDPSESQSQTNNEPKRRKMHARKKLSNVTAVKTEVHQNGTHDKKGQQSPQDHLFVNSNSKQRSGSKRFMCKECGYATDLTSDLKRHMLRHGGDKPHKCHKCPYAAMAKSKLLIHLKCHAADGPLKCQKCGFSTTHKGVLTRHMAVHRAAEAKKSDDVTACTNHRHQPTSHMAVRAKQKTDNDATTSQEDTHGTAHGSNQTSQNRKRKYKSGKSWQKSTSSEYKKKVYKSSVMTEKAEERRQEAMNYEMDTGEEPCRRTRHSLEKGKRRIKPSATNLSKPYRCGQCVYATNHVREFDLHLAQHSAPSPKRYLCGQCSFATSERSKWEMHMFKHSETKRFACEECNFKTNYEFTLSAHLQKVHELRKPKNDKHVSKSKLSPSKSQSYKKATKLSPPKSPSYKLMYTVDFSKHSTLYNCKQCDYATALKVSMLLHVKTHTEEKPQTGNSDSNASNSGKQASGSKAPNRRLTVP
ncbi:uncharacterized protein LOC144867074 [Branchiostoma floridae x Branchiostoma japonicum]